MFILYWIPKNLLSYGVGKLMAVQWPAPICHMLIRAFASLYRINLNEAEKPVEGYSTVNEFFCRRLKGDVRPLGPGPYLHPCDSQMTARGEIVGDQLLQAKGRSYSLKAFLQTERLEPWSKGYFVTYYLCPTDYHRVHSPVEGRIKEVRYVPGQLWPVNDWSVSEIKDLFVKNERVIVDIETDRGLVSVVFVGATNVGSIRLTFEPSLRTNHSHRRDPRVITYVDPIVVKRGDELGLFEMGSTVIVVAGPQWSILSSVVQSSNSKSVKMGQAPE